MVTVQTTRGLARSFLECTDLSEGALGLDLSGYTKQEEVERTAVPQLPPLL